MGDVERAGPTAARPWQGAHSEVITAIWREWVRVAAQCEVIRAILLEDSPCGGGHTAAGLLEASGAECDVLPGAARGD